MLWPCVKWPIKCTTANEMHSGGQLGPVQNVLKIRRKQLWDGVTWGLCFN